MGICNTMGSYNGFVFKYKGIGEGRGFVRIYNICSCIYNNYIYMTQCVLCVPVRRQPI